MASTTSTLQKIHVFPSNTSFNKNLASVGNNDIALVKTDLLDKLAGNTTPTLVALVDWDTMKIRNGGTDVRNINNTAAGIKAYGGDYSFPTTAGGSDSRIGTIMLKESYTLYDKILVIGTNDNGDWNCYRVFDVWKLQKCFENGYRFTILGESGVYWYIYTSVANGTEKHLLSTDTIWYMQDQNGGIQEIYGIKY